MLINFIVPDAYAKEVEMLSDRRLKRDYPYWFGGGFNWAAQTWLVLRQYRDGLTIGDCRKSGQVNVGHVNLWRAVGARRGEFRVSMRADYRRVFDVDFEILQNPTVPTGLAQAYLPYWPVPGIIPRESKRRGVKTVAYAGRIGPRNLVPSLRKVAVGPDALDFRIIPPHLWHNMSEIDVLVAIRSFDRACHPTKPPSKLFNAWRAGIPLIAGWDSAFSAIGRPDIDYIRVETEAQFFEALNRLASDQSFYQSIVTAGRARAPEVSHDAIAKIWLDCLDNQVLPQFEAWQDRGGARVKSILNRGADLAFDTASKMKSRVMSRSKWG